MLDEHCRVEHFRFFSEMDNYKECLLLDVYCS